jgi:hypothetical protein
MNSLNTMMNAATPPCIYLDRRCRRSPSLAHFSFSLSLALSCIELETLTLQLMSCPAVSDHPELWRASHRLRLSFWSFPYEIIEPTHPQSPPVNLSLPPLPPLLVDHDVIERPPITSPKTPMRSDELLVLQDLSSLPLPCCTTLAPSAIMQFCSALPLVVLR